MIDLHPLIEPSFWFDLSPDFLSPAFSKGFFLLFAALIVAGAVVRIIARSKTADRFAREIRLRIGSLLLTTGIFGMVWFFFSFEGIRLFGARFWFLGLIVMAIVWAVTIWRYAKTEVPQMREKAKSQADANKYLPRRSR